MGTANGDVFALDVGSWRQETILHVHGAVREIATTPDGRTLAILSNDGTVSIGATDDSAREPMRWVTARSHARGLAFTSGGLLLVTCTDGTLWLHFLRSGRWHCRPTGTMDLGQIAISPDEKTAVVLDRQGRILWIDLDMARKLLEAVGSPVTERA